MLGAHKLVESTRYRARLTINVRQKNRIMIIRKYLLILVLFHLPLASGFAEDEPTTSNVKRVQEYVEAYNKKDVDTMMDMVSEKIQWIYITGDQIAVEATGKEQLRKSLTAYFESASKVKSDLEWIRATSTRVAALERVSWPTKNGVRSQSSLSVYEFDKGEIMRVYYYPSEK